VNSTHTTTIRWLSTIAVASGLAAFLWYGLSQGWWESAYRWARLELAQDGATKSSDGERGMDMPGMNMGATAVQSHPAASVAGHATIAIPGEIQQRIGVTVGRVEQAPLRMSVQTVGIVQVNETMLAHVHLKVEGWLQKVYVDYTGQKVRKGDPLLEIYSPEFFATQREFLIARQGEPAGAGKSNALSLADAARRRLELWDVPADEIQQLERTGNPRTYLTLRSPLTGTVLMKNAFMGQHVTPQTELYEVADLSTVWVQAKVYEYELPHVEMGQPAAVTFPALPERKFAGRVVFIQPTVDEPTRTVQVRVELSNRDGSLKPGMFGNVRIEHTMGDGLLVPTSAVIRTGEKDIAYRVEPENHFAPVQVKISLFVFGDRFQVLEGLKAGEQVVTSANFLIDSESRLRVSGMGAMPGMQMGDMPGMKMNEPDQKGPTTKTIRPKERSSEGMDGMDQSQMKH
jgi:Cu(I)/Ag(I) efflux system membrane fusion protein